MHALEQGVNFVDTANAYSAGASERFVGKALQGGGARRVVLATKRSSRRTKDPNARGLSRRHLIEACDASLSACRPIGSICISCTAASRHSDRRDAARARRPDPRRARCATSAPACSRLEDRRGAVGGEGARAQPLRLRAAGVPHARPHRRARGDSGGADVRPRADPVGAAVRRPADRQVQRDDQSAAGRWQGGKDNFGRPATPAAWDVIDGLVALAKEKSCSASQLALAWNASQPGITAPIIGPRTLEQVADNLGAVDVKVTDADRARIDALAPPWSPAALLRGRARDRLQAESRALVIGALAARLTRPRQVWR